MIHSTLLLTIGNGRFSINRITWHNVRVDGSSGIGVVFAAVQRHCAQRLSSEPMPSWNEMGK